MIGFYLLRQSQLTLAVLCLVMVLGVGVTRLVLAGYSRERAQQQMQQQVGDWHSQLSGELPAEQRQAWADLGHRDPEAMLRVCAFERPGHD